MRLFDDGNKGGFTSAAEGKEQILVLALVSSAIDAVEGHNLDLHLMAPETDVTQWSSSLQLDFCSVTEAESRRRGVLNTIQYLNAHGFQSGIFRRSYYIYDRSFV